MQPVWGGLTKQRVGAYAEYFVKMELTRYGFQVYGTEVGVRSSAHHQGHHQGRGPDDYPTEFTAFIVKQRLLRTPPSTKGSRIWANSPR